MAEHLQPFPAEPTAGWPGPCCQLGGPASPQARRLGAGISDMGVHLATGAWSQSCLEHCPLKSPKGDGATSSVPARPVLEHFSIFFWTERPKTLISGCCRGTKPLTKPARGSSLAEWLWGWRRFLRLLLQNVNGCLRVGQNSPRLQQLRGEISRPRCCCATFQLCSTTTTKNKWQKKCS